MTYVEQMLGDQGQAYRRLGEEILRQRSWRPCTQRPISRWQV